MPVMAWGVLWVVFTVSGVNLVGFGAEWLFLGVRKLGG